jgi:hypothetical protein
LALNCFGGFLILVLPIHGSIFRILSILKDKVALSFTDFLSIDFILRVAEVETGDLLTCLFKACIGTYDSVFTANTGPNR